jgi:hypothetical protein
MRVVMNIWVPYIAGNFLMRWTGSFEGRFCSVEFIF